MKIHKYFSDITTQSYSSKKIIQGVVLIDLPKYNDDSGSFSEIIRLDHGLLSKSVSNLIPEFKVEQVSWSILKPNGIKAFHVHYNQDDLWFVPGSETLVVGLYDIRDDSDTFELKNRFVLGSGKSHLLYIPKGVAHGCANLETTSMHLMYFVNSKFDAVNPDEHRLPYDILGKDFWEKTPG